MHYFPCPLLSNNICMKTLRPVIIGLLGVVPTMLSAQLSIAASNTPYTITFDATVAGVNNGSFTAAATYGASSPSTGQLDTDGIIVSGNAGTTLNWGTVSSLTTALAASPSPNTSNGGVGAGGVYAFSNNGGSNRFLGFQPSGSVAVPGGIIVRAQNNTGNTITGFTVSYKGYYFNDQSNGHTVTGYYSTDGSTWTSLSSSFNFSSPITAGAASWAAVSGLTASITGLSISNAGYMYIKWVFDQTSSGTRDEIGIDDIAITATTTACTTPTAEATVLTFTPTSSQLTIGCTAGGGSSRLIVLRQGSAVSFSPADNTTYTANADFSAGTDLGGSTKVVYNGSGASVTVTNLTAGTTYYAKIVEYGCGAGAEKYLTANPLSGNATTTTSTTLYMGDIVLVGIDPNYTYGGSSSCDKLSFMTLVDINQGTAILLTDCGYERGLAANVTSGIHNNCGEGLIRLTWNNTTPLAAGTVFEIKPCESAYSGWTFENIGLDLGLGSFDVASAGDQLFVMQGAWASNALTGTYIYGVNTTVTGWVATSSAVANAASGDNTSRLPSGLKCLNFDGNLTLNEARYKAAPTGVYTDSRALLLRYITDEANWDLGTSAYSKPANFTISSIGGTYGRWFGDNDNDWFNSCNWDLFRVPDSTTDVYIPTNGGLGTGADNSPTLNAAQIAYCKNITLAGNGGVYPLTGVANAQLHVYGSWSSSHVNDFIESTATVHFRSTSAQSINNSAAPEVFYNLTMNGNGGVTLEQDIQVTNQLTCTKGIISTGSRSVVVANSAANSITGQSTSSYIWGNLQRAVTGNTTYDFPVGTSNRYQLARVALGAGAVVGGGALRASFNASIGGAAPAVPNTAQDSVYTDMLDCGIWTIEPLTNSFSGSYGVTLFARGASNASSIGMVIKRPDIAGSWTAPGTHTGCANSGGVVTASRTGLSSFSQFGVAILPVILGIDWESISAEQQTNLPVPHTRIQWKMACSQPLLGDFWVETATDAQVWQRIGHVTANSQPEVPYAFEDTTQNTGLRLYRVVYVDADGMTLHSPTVATQHASAHTWTVAPLYPNPVQSKSHLAVYVPQDGTCSLRIYNAAGALVSEQQQPLHAGNHVLTMDFAHLPKGFYLIGCAFEGEVQWQKVLRE